LVIRLASYVFTLWGSFSVAFLFFRSIPGNPIQGMIATLEQQSITVPGADELVEEYREVFGLEGTLAQQYIRYVKNIVLSRDLGPSILSFPTHAQDLIFRALPWTMGLLGLTVIIGWAIGLLIGALVGWNRDTHAASWLTNLAICISQIPYYFLALIFVFLFAYVWKVLPARGAYSGLLKPGLSLRFIGSLLKHGILPALSLVVVIMSRWLISTRSLMISILEEDYLIMARAKGLEESHILIRYGLRNVLLPQVTGLGMALGFVLNGSYLVEWIFAYPGLGTLFADAVGMLDFNVMQGVILLSITAVLTANLVIDLAMPLVDPRIGHTRT